MPQKRSYKEVQQEWKEELKKLLTFRHPNITYIYDAFEYKDTCYLIIEYCDYTLQDIFKNCDQELRESLIPYIAKDLLQGIDFIHSIDYVHKDIHPGNVFVRITKSQSTEQNPHFICKIGDLGISNLENNIDQLNTILAQWMLPPEFLSSQKFGLINRQVDIYHTGLLLLSLLLGHTPEFTRQHILEGKPRQMAEQHLSPYGKIIAKALRRHTKYRTQTALEFWREIRIV